jgi:BolA protein
MSIQATVEHKLSEALQPIHLEVVNESSNHNVPPGSESHFKVVVVSELFAGEGLVARHRRVNRVLRAELAGSIHALALHTLAPDEWFERAGRTTESPECLGGAKRQADTPEAS